MHLLLPDVNTDTDEQIILNIKENNVAPEVQVGAKTRQRSIIRLVETKTQLFNKNSFVWAKRIHVL